MSKKHIGTTALSNICVHPHLKIFYNIVESTRNLGEIFYKYYRVSVIGFVFISAFFSFIKKFLRVYEDILLLVVLF